MRPFLIAGLLLAAAAPALANDTTAQLAAGGLELTRTDAIEMRSEDLFISRKAVRVRYVFANTSGRDVTVRVAFPMPVLEGEVLNYQDVSVPQPDSDNFLGFATEVDGKRVQAELEQRAFAGGREQTAWLRAHHVPIAPHLAATEAAIARLTPAERAEGQRLKLLSEDDAPIWSMRATYHWMQTFPAGRPITVEHRYTPSVGGTVATGLGTPYGAETVQRYCADASLIAAVRRARQTREEPFTEQWVDYVLTTGANWKKPIGSFRLVIDKENPRDLVSFCGDGVRKLDATRFEMRKANWRPTRDLAILFLVPTDAQ